MHSSLHDFRHLSQRNMLNNKQTLFIECFALLIHYHILFHIKVHPCKKTKKHDSKLHDRDIMSQMATDEH